MNLEHFDAHRNDIQELSVLVDLLRKLRYLDLSNNAITVVPYTITNVSARFVFFLSVLTITISPHYLQLINALLYEFMYMMLLVSIYFIFLLRQQKEKHPHFC